MFKKERKIGLVFTWNISALVVKKNAKKETFKIKNLKERNSIVSEK